MLLFCSYPDISWGIISEGNVPAPEAAPALALINMLLIGKLDKFIFGGPQRPSYFILIPESITAPQQRMEFQMYFGGHEGAFYL